MYSLKLSFDSVPDSVCDVAHVLYLVHETLISVLSFI